MSESIVIMCGGRGRRLGSLTENIPKPLVKVGDKPVLELKLHRYTDQGFRDFVICVGYKGDLIRSAVSGFNLDANFQFSDAGEAAGILKRLHHARALFSEHAFITYGDTYTDLDLKELLATHKKSAFEATIVVAPIQNPFGLVEFDSELRVTQFREKPILNYYIGYAVINQTAFDLVPQSVVDMPDGKGLVAFFRILMALEKLGAYHHSGLQITFNTEDELKAAERQILHFFTTREEP